MKRTTQAVVRTTVLCAALGLGGLWGWPRVEPSAWQLWTVARGTLAGGSQTPEVGFDTLLIDLVATAAAVIYVCLVSSVVVVVGSVAVGLRRPACRHRWTGLMAGLCGLGMVMTPVSTFAASGTHHGTGSQVSGEPSLNGLPMPDLPASLPLPPDGARVRMPAVDRVTVRQGDTLWQIAAGRLPRSASDTEIAAAVAHWYAHNRLVIGADQDLIFPGTQLEQPGGHR
jgi:nucleoid-associated protein YgaU